MGGPCGHEVQKFPAGRKQSPIPVGKNLPGLIIDVMDKSVCLIKQIIRLRVFSVKSPGSQKTTRPPGKPGLKPRSGQGQGCPVHAGPAPLRLCLDVPGDILEGDGKWEPGQGMIQVRHKGPAVFLQAPERGGVAPEHPGQPRDQTLGVKPARHQGVENGRRLEPGSGHSDYLCRIIWGKQFSRTGSAGDGVVFRLFCLFQD